MKRPVLGLALTMTASILLAACSDEPEIPMVTQEAYDELLVELDEAYLKMEDGIKLSDMGKSSLKVVEGSTTEDFEFVENKFILPSPLTIEGATGDVNASNVQVGSFFKFTPSDNWIMRMGGTSLHLNHNVGIVGQISALNIAGFDIFTADYKDILLQYSKTIPTKNSTYNSLFVGTNERGALAVHDVQVNGAAGQLVVGIVVFGDVGLVFTFVLDGQDLATQLELTKLMISSGTYADNKIRIE